MLEDVLLGLRFDFAIAFDFGPCVSCPKPFTRVALDVFGFGLLRVFVPVSSCTNCSRKMSTFLGLCHGRVASFAANAAAATTIPLAVLLLLRLPLLFSLLLFSRSQR